MTFIVNVFNSTGKATFQTDNFSYTDKLNLTNEAVVFISGSTPEKRKLLNSGSKVEIFKNGIREFYGVVNAKTYLNGGGLSLRCKGFEFEMSKKNMIKKVWKNTQSSIIFNEIFDHFGKYKGSIATGVNLDFKSDVSSSIANTVGNLSKKTDQDLEFDYTNEVINIVNHKGSSTSVITLNDGIDITNLGADVSTPMGNVIKVYGKGDGENQIRNGVATGRNDVSIAAYGEIEKVERDMTIISVSEADRLADILAVKYGEETKTYNFQVLNPSLNLKSGDVITLNSPDKDLDNEEVRIVGVKKGVKNGSEFLELQVTNKEYSELMKSSDKEIGRIKQDAKDQQTYSQGTTNVLTFSGQNNGDSGHPLRLSFNIPSDFYYDEAGNRRINSFNLDYDIDPFRQTAGDVSEVNKSPEVGGTSSTTDIYSDEGTASNSSKSLISGWNTNVLNEYISGTFNLLFIKYRIRPNFTDSNIYFAVKFNIGEGYEEHFAALDTNVDNVIIEKTVAVPLFQSISSTVDMDVYTNSPGSYSLEMNVYGGLLNHNHGDGNYQAASHNHEVQIGDEVDDSADLNATGVILQVQHWTGSSWVTKYSVSKSNTLLTDTDLTNNNTLPDAPGYWRVNVATNSSNPDLIKGIVKIRHNLDT